jgi:5-methylcytosine-specific restriction enzyme A
MVLMDESFDYLFCTERWSRVSARHLSEHPLCQYCLERAIISRAVLCVPSEGHYVTALVSLCVDCAESTARAIEAYGYRCDIGLDGYPCDPNHPFNRA